MIVIESDFEYRGYRCIVTFNSRGWRCGYVGVPSGHPFYGLSDSDEKISQLACHGGVTYAGNGNHFVNSDLWWIGFDCAHAGDGYDIKTIKKLWGDNQVVSPSGGVVRTNEYVQQGCRGLVNQIERKRKGM